MFKISVKLNPQKERSCWLRFMGTRELQNFLSLTFWTEIVKYTSVTIVFFVGVVETKLSHKIADKINRQLIVMETFGWKPLGGNLWVETFGWKPLGGNLWVETFGWKPLGGNLWVETFGWKTLGGNLWVAACAQCWTANDPLLDYYGKSCSPLLEQF